MRQLGSEVWKADGPPRATSCLADRFARDIRCEDANECVPGLWPVLANSSTDAERGGDAKACCAIERAVIFNSFCSLGRLSADALSLQEACQIEKGGIARFQIVPEDLQRRRAG